MDAFTLTLYTVLTFSEEEWAIKLWLFRLEQKTFFNLWLFRLTA